MKACLVSVRGALVEVIVVVNSSVILVVTTTVARGSVCVSTLVTVPPGFIQLRSDHEI